MDLQLKGKRAFVSGSSSGIGARIVDYGCAKAALDNFSVNISKTLGPKGVTVNIVAPGITLSPGVETWLETIRKREGWPDDLEANEREYAAKYCNQTILRMGRPRDLAVAVALMASPLGGYINGADLRVDGGANL